MSQQPPVPDSNPKTYRALLKMLPPLSPGARVLDVPCGSGAMSWELLQRGCTPVPGDLFTEKYSLTEVPCQKIDLNEPLPFDSGSFDAAVFCEGPQVVENAALALRELARVLKPNGVLLLALPNVSNLFSRCRFLLTGFYNKFIRPYDEFGGEGNTHPMTYPELRYYLRRSGFSIESVGTNRYKLSHLLPFPLGPVVWGLTGLMVTQKCRRSPMKEAARELWRHTTSFPLLFGEALLIKAVKKS